MSGNNSLHFAVMRPDITSCDIKKLIQQGVSAEDTNREGNTPLHLAVLNPLCKVEVLDELLKHDIDINKFSGDWNTALHLAVQSNCNVKVIQKLLQFDANVCALNSNGDTPLHIAARQQEANLEVIKLLLKYGAEVNKQNVKFETPLYDVIKKHRCMVDILKSHPVHHELHFCDLEAMKELLKNGADLLVETFNYLYPLSAAFERAYDHESCNIPCINLLIKYGMLRYYSQKYSLIVYRASYRGRLNKPSRYVESFIKNCAREVACMKSCKITPDCKLFDFVSNGNIKRSLQQSDDIDVTRKILNILLDGEFPIYHDIIPINVGRKPLLKILSQLDIYTISTCSEGENSRVVFLSCDSILACANYMCLQDLVNFTLAYMHPKHS